MSELAQKIPMGRWLRILPPDYDCMHYFLYGPC